MNKKIKRWFSLRTRSIILRFVLAIFLIFSFTAISLPLLKDLNNLSPQDATIIGENNVWRVIVIFGILTSVIVLFTFWKRVFRLTAVFLIGFWVVGTTGFIAYINFTKYSSKENRVLFNSPKIINSSNCNEQKTLELIKRCTVVIIRDDGKHGTGFSPEKGYVVTTKHTVEETKSVSTWLYRQENLTLWAAAPNLDLAILKLPKAIPVCPWADARHIKLADSLYTVGWPNVPRGESSITKGIFSRSFSSKEGPEFIQTDAAINPGNSGGPLVNKCGVVGMMTAKLTWSESNIPSEGFGIALSSNYIKPIINYLIKRGKPHEFPLEKSKTRQYTPIL